MKDFRDLVVWQKAHALVLSVYSASADLPSDERYGLTSQIRRSASSIPANIAEGCGRGSDAEIWLAVCKSQWDPPASWNTISFSRVISVSCPNERYERSPMASPKSNACSADSSRSYNSPRMAGDPPNPKN